jgi:two-component system, LytTR family, response regulator
MVMNTKTVEVGGYGQLDPYGVYQLEANVNYTKIHFFDGKKIVVAATLKSFEQKLQNFPNFFRINRSLMINMDYVRAFKDEEIILKDGKRMYASRRRKKALFELLNGDNSPFKLI